MKKTTAKAKKPKAKVQDMKPKKDAKGGGVDYRTISGRITSVTSDPSDHN
jgi:hypothetical protein